MWEEDRTCALLETGRDATPLIVLLSVPPSFNRQRHQQILQVCRSGLVEAIDLQSVHHEPSVPSFLSIGEDATQSKFLFFTLLLQIRLLPSQQALEGNRLCFTRRENTRRRDARCMC